MQRVIARTLVMAAAIGLWAASALAAEPIKIGVLVTLTGPAAFLGAPMKPVFENEVAAVNNSGGLLGRKLELIMYDDGGSTEKAQSFVKRLIENDGVDILIGGTSTATSMVAAGLAEKAEIPFITWGGAITLVEPVKKWVFKVTQTDRMAAQKVLGDMKKRGMTRIALISEDVGFGKSGHDQTVALAPSYGIEIVADETYSSKDPDTTAQLTKIKNAAGVQAVFNWGFGQGPAIVTKNFRQLGMTVPLYETHGVASKEFIQLAGEAANGIRLPASGLLVADQLPADDPQKAVVMAFKKAYEDMTKGEINTYAGHADDLLKIALAAITRAGTTDKAAVRDEIEKTSGFIGNAGTFNFTATDHLGLGPQAFHIVEIKNGEWQLID